VLTPTQTALPVSHTEPTLLKLANAARVLTMADVPTCPCPHLLCARSITRPSCAHHKVQPCISQAINVSLVPARKRSRLLTCTPHMAPHKVQPCISQAINVSLVPARKRSRLLTCTPHMAPRAAQSAASYQSGYKCMEVK
jgi:hypothetical protein